jgi:lipoprotein-anchoring transpeptidase ErfK/SrfK
VLSVRESLLPKHAFGVTVTISVTQPAGTRVRTIRLLLLPRPPLPLYVASTTRTARASEAVDVLVATTPGSKLTISVALTNTVVVSGTGVADKDGHWVYSGILYVALKHPMTAHVTVHASNGLDQGTGHASFLLRPGPSGLLRGGIQDRLATAVDPTPQLERYFTTIPDKLIVVSTEGQTLRIYDHGALVHEDYVTTGRPELPTPHGIFQVMARYSPFTFISPWPAGSPYYYPPSPVRFALLFRDGGYFLHDAPWRSVYGPGTNLPHSSDPGEPLGTHGCINIPLSDMVWLWNFAGVGTTVIVI